MGTLARCNYRQPRPASGDPAVPLQAAIDPTRFPRAGKALQDAQDLLREVWSESMLSHDSGAAEAQALREAHAGEEAEGGAGGDGLGEEGEGEGGVEGPVEGRRGAMFVPIELPEVAPEEPDVDRGDDLVLERMGRVPAEVRLETTVQMSVML